jgi:hypothetical protein
MKGKEMTKQLLRVGAATLFLTSLSPCQNALIENKDETPTDTQTTKESRHLFWIIPNNRTSPSLTDYHPLTAGEKFKVASEDSWDRGTFALAVFFGGEGQLNNSNRAFGQGAAGFGRYVGASYGDFVIGNYMTEGVFPTLLHQDPRYFRRGTGGGWSRMKYAMSQTFLTRGDSGRVQLNYSEWLGNSAAVAISNSYYADNRTASNAVSKLGMQVGIDMAANVLKEFYPDIARKFHRKHRNEDGTK